MLAKAAIIVISSYSISSLSGGENPVVTVDFRLGAKDKSDSSWKEIAKSREQRDHNCREVAIIY